MSQVIDQTLSQALARDIMNGTIWITWENQRRTNELAKTLGVPLFKCASKRNYLLRVATLSAKTFFILLRHRPKRLIVQNPSIVLATVVCLLQRIFGYFLVIDRHSNFRIEKAPFRSMKEKVFQIMSRYTIRKAHLTIVTNGFLKNLVDEWGGRGIVLQDKLPALTLAEKLNLTGRYNIVYVCSYSGDEPVNEVIKAARLIDPRNFVYITGNQKRLRKKIIEEAPKNIIFTGFVEEKAYQSLLYSSDAVMALTTANHFLLCGAYEAVSLGKPLILSDTQDLREYFHRGVIFTKNNAESLAGSLEAAIRDKKRLENEISRLQEELTSDWDTRFGQLLKRIQVL